MSFLMLLLITGFIGYIAYTFTDNSEDDPVQRRLMEFAAASKQNNRNNEQPQSDTGLIKNLMKLFDPITSIISKKLNPGMLKQLLLESGMSSSDEDVYKFIAQKVVLGSIGAAAAMFLSLSGSLQGILALFFPPLAALTLFRLPDIKLKSIIKKKNTEITYNLPDALDLLTVCVEAGLGLDAAFVRVSQELTRTCPILAKEMNRVSKDIMSGISRSESFRAMAQRNNVPDLRSFVALLIQTDKLGTSISQSLRVYSDTMRTKRRQRAEKLAAQASIKMTIPLVLFILPSMFVVILAPAAFTLFANFKNMAGGQ